MKRVLVFLQACFFILIFVGSASAANITIISAERHIHANVDAGPSSDSEHERKDDLGSWVVSAHAEAYSDISWDGGFVDASQNSNISLVSLASGLVVGGEGEVHVESSGGMQNGDSTLSVTFTVGVATDYKIVLHTMEGDSASVRLDDDVLGNGIIFGYDQYHTGNTYTGTLEAGTYYFDGGASADEYLRNASYDFDFTVGTVPIPSAAWLLGTGLLGLAGFRRRYNKA